MLKRFLPLLLLASVAFSPSKASAQYLEDDEKSYITKGFFMSAEYGFYFFLVKPSALDRPNGPQASLLGSMGGIEIGYDIADIFSLQFTFWAPSVRGNTQTGGGGANYLFNLGATIHFLRFKQLYVYGKLGAGLSLALPPEPGGELGLMIHAGLGIRYYTRLRHFSIGIEAIVLVRPVTFGGTPAPGDSTLSLGLGLMPCLTYNF